MTEKSKGMGKQIRALRRLRGMSQADLALRCGFERTSITNIERGNQRISLDRLHAIANALGYELKIKFELKNKKGVIMSEGLIDISKLDKAKVLAALYNHSQPLGMGMIHFKPEDMTVSEAQAIVDTGQTYFDYLIGRVMKSEIGGDTFDPCLYDRDNGNGAALKAIESIGNVQN